MTDFVQPITWGGTALIYSVYLNHYTTDIFHLKERGDRAMTLQAGTAAIGQIVTQGTAVDRVALTTTQGQPGPVFVLLEPLTAGSPAAQVRLGANNCNVLIAGTATPGTYLRASATTGLAEPTTDYTSAFGQSTSSGAGNAGTPGTVTAALFSWPGARLAGTPAFTFGTANSAGTAGTFVRADATLAAFGTALPGTATITAGTAAFAARGDHSHGSSGSGSSSGSLLWDPFGLAVAPVATDLSVHDQWAGSGIITELTQQGSAVVFKNPNAGVTVERGAFGGTAGPLAVPAPPYTATACFIANTPLVTNASCSLTLRQSSNDTRIACRLYLDTTAVKLEGSNWSDYQTKSASFGTISWFWCTPIWLRIRDDATSRYWEVSMDGKWFNAYTSGSSGSGCVPTQAGITMNTFGNGSGGLMSMILLSLSVVNTA